MRTSKSLDGASSQSPSGALPDLVYPLHLLDNFKHNHICVSFILRFDDVLDPKKLSDSLSRLLEIGDWRKLGGRLRYQNKNNGKLEVHVPAAFTKERPAIAFSHLALSETKINEHPLGSQFPKLTDGPSVQPIPAKNGFQIFAVRADFPSTIKEMVAQDAPQLSLHVSSFKDATLVSLAWPHVTMDAMGQKAILEAWTLVLAGKEDQVPPIIGARDDVLEKVDTLSQEQQEEELVVNRWRAGFWATLQIIVLFLWRNIWNPSRENKVVYFPQETMKQLRREAAQGEDGEFVSDGDLLSAWTIQAVAATHSKPLPITAIQLTNARFRLPWLQMSEGVLMQNIVMLTFAFLSSKLAIGPLGPTARAHRHHLTQQATETQVTLFLNKIRGEINTNGKPKLLFGERNAVPIAYNNLVKAGFITGTDFSPAVVSLDENVESTRSLSGKPVTCYHEIIPWQGARPANALYTLGKDYSGDYWLMGSFYPKTWQKLESDMERWKKSAQLNKESETPATGL